jgi:hypothetical protein
LYNSGVLSDADIAKLGKHNSDFPIINSLPTDTNINSFMHFYREAFPEATVLPKMHFLEEHVIPWLKKWKIGFGLILWESRGQSQSMPTSTICISLTGAFQIQYREWSTLCESTFCTLHQPMSLPNLLLREGNSIQKSS